MNDSSDFKFRTSYVLTPSLQTFWNLHIRLIELLGEETRKIVGSFGQKAFIRFLTIQMN